MRKQGPMGTTMTCRTVMPGMLLAALALGACAPQQPLPYSPHYSRMQLTEPGHAHAPGVVSKGYDAGARSQTVMVPQACITPDTAEQPLYLPPGCANSLNLQMMVERPEDLTRGRRMGPAPAGPSVRAAQRYISGATDADRRAGKSDSNQTDSGADTPPRATRQEPR